MTAGTEYASFRAWEPQRYLQEYYTCVEADEEATLQFLVDAARHIGPVDRMLDFGCGPTVHHLFPFAPYAPQIDVSDYLTDNLDAVRAWVEQREGAHDWSDFARLTLQLESGRAPDVAELHVREHLTRDRIHRFLPADAHHASPLSEPPPGKPYPLVLCCFCPDSITTHRDAWRACMLNIISLVAPGGWLVLAALRGTDHYAVGTQRFPSAGITADDIAEVLADTGLWSGDTRIATAGLDPPGKHGFRGIVLARARRMRS